MKHKTDSSPRPLNHCWPGSAKPFTKRLGQSGPTTWHVVVHNNSVPGGIGCCGCPGAAGAGDGAGAAGAGDGAGAAGAGDGAGAAGAGDCTGAAGAELAKT